MSERFNREPQAASATLSELTAVVRARWGLILFIVVGCASLGALLATTYPKFQAGGFYYTPGWTLADYKRLRSEFGSAEVLESYFSESVPADQKAAKLLIASAAGPRFWDASAKPLFPLTKKDAKEIFEGTKDRDSASIMGLEFSLGARSKETAREGVLLLGDFLTQTLLLTSLQSWVAAGQTSAIAEFLRAENQVLQTRYSIEQTQRRISELRALQSKYPESQRMELRQVVSADPASARYLAPIAQVVALESAVAESNEALRRLERRAGQLEVETAFFLQAVKAIEKSRRGWTLLDNIEQVKKLVFAPLDHSEDAIKELSNRLDLELSAFRNQFSIAFGFRSEVLLPMNSQRSVTRFAALGGLLGLAVAAMLFFVPIVVRAWLTEVDDYDSEPAEAIGRGRRPLAEREALPERI